MFKKEILKNSQMELFALKMLFPSIKLFNANQQEAMKKDISKRTITLVNVLKEVVGEKNSKVLQWMLEIRKIKLDIVLDIIKEEIDQTILEKEIVIDCSQLLKK